MNTGGKIITSVASVLLLGLAIFVYVKFFFVYSEGTNEGDINYFQREGFVFKTYEGKMIQTGYNSHNTSATIQSNEFKFSVVDERIAEQIDSNSSRLNVQFFIRPILIWSGENGVWQGRKTIL